jgi:hypothetical protein
MMYKQHIVLVCRMYIRQVDLLVQKPGLLLVANVFLFVLLSTVDGIHIAECCEQVGAIS